MVMIPRIRSLVSLYIIYIHKRFICSSGLKYIKKSNSGKPQIICLKCFSLSKRNLETKYIYHKVYILDHALFIAQSFIFYHTTVALGCLIHIWQNVYLVAKSPTNSNVCTYVAKHRNLTIWQYVSSVIFSLCSFFKNFSKKIFSLTQN